MDKHSPVLGIIPARVHSSRFPNKILAKISGNPMIWHVWRAALSCKRFSRVVVATDGEDIFNEVLSFGGEAVMVSGDYKSGTDRVAALASQSPESIVINIQGDEPLISPNALESLITTLEEDSSIPMATLAVSKESAADYNNPNVVKVDFDKNGFAQDFYREPRAGQSRFFKHIGIYGFQKEALERFVSLPTSPLEDARRLEQLRAIENNLRIKICLTEQDTVAVDRREDIALVEAELLDRTSQAGKVTHYEE